MYNIPTIQTNLQTVVGFLQEQNPQIELLSTNLTTATSGLFCNDGSVPYVNLQNIKDLGVNFNNFIFPEWISTIAFLTGNRIKYVYPLWLIGNTYAVRQRVVLNNVGYESLYNNNTGNSPATNRQSWKLLNEYYAIYDAILKIISTTSDSLVNGKTYRIDTLLLTDDFTNIGYVTAGIPFVATGTTPTIWTNSTIVYNLTDATNVNKSPDLNPTYWTEINLFNEFLENRLKTSISNVVNDCLKNRNSILSSKSLYYVNNDGITTIANDTQNCGIKIDFNKDRNIKLKINKIGLHFAAAITNQMTFYLYNQNIFVKSFVVQPTSNNFEWFTLTDCELTTTGVGSCFLYYNRTGLNAEAITNNVVIPRNTDNFVVFNQFEAPSGLDLKLIDESYYKYGIAYISNIDYSIVPDFTEWISLNKNLFAEAIKYQFCLEIYKMYYANSEIRSNRTERNIDFDIIKAEIFSTSEESLNKKLQNIIKDLRIAIADAKIDNLLNNKKKYFSYGIAI
jgi:hypothetical protein